MPIRFLIGPFLCGLALSLPAQDSAKLPRTFVPPPLDRYLEARTHALTGAEWMEGITPGNWPERQAALRGELQDMLGLDPWPARTPLLPVITGTVDGAGYVVEKLHFEPLPGLYIGANLYRPAAGPGPWPTVLYMSGHAHVMEGKVRIGNKAGYQHHGAAFARQGYVCLIPDTIQLGEIPGEHHGTYRLNRWWWASRGYTPAGVEAWIGIRALDYLESRPEVDRARIGMTGRSGGGAYTWWVAALDERIKAAVPVAGITTLHDHVVEGAIEGHCDCMFMVNSRQWDFDRVAALVAPRPLLISNTDNDPIFPLTGVLQIHQRMRQLYGKLGKEDHLGLHIAEGPHKDTQPLNAGAFHWLNRFLKGGDRMDLMDEPARKRHEPRDLKVFGEIPADEKVTSVDEFFVAAFVPPAAPTAAAWPEQRARWMKSLTEAVFRAWPTDRTNLPMSSPVVQEREGQSWTRTQVTVQEPLALPLWVGRDASSKTEPLRRVVLHILDDASAGKLPAGAVGEWSESSASKAGGGSDPVSPALQPLPGEAMAIFFPRGTGPTGFGALPAVKQAHLRRRFLLLGETVESGQVRDICQAVKALGEMPGLRGLPVTLRSSGEMAANVVYASLFSAGLERLELSGLPVSHRTGPTYLNILRHMDLPQALAMAAERTPVVLRTAEPEAWSYATAVVQVLGRPDHLQFRSP